MAVTVLTDDDFAAKLAEADNAIVDFYAGWCGPCIMFKPKFNRISNDYPHVTFFMVNGEASPAARKTVTIDNLPFFGLYKKGERVDGFSTTEEPYFRQKIEETFGKGGAS